MRKKYYFQLLLAFMLFAQNVNAQKPSEKPPPTPEPTPVYIPIQPSDPSSPYTPKAPEPAPKSEKLPNELLAIFEINKNNLCGNFKETFLKAKPATNIKGNISILSKDTAYITTLKTIVTINLAYEYFNDIQGSLIHPDGSVTKFVNKHNFEVSLPGIYVLQYFILCSGKLQSGKKIIVCTDEIICNCGPVENDNLKVSKNGIGSNGFITNGETITIDKTKKTLISKEINCEGNICNGFNTYKIIDNNNIVFDSGALNINKKFKLSNTGNYTLIINSFCNNKICNTYKYPILFTGENAEENHIKKIQFCWGNQVGLFIANPSIANASIYEGYTTGLLGLIANISIGKKNSIHFWPALNIYNTNYKSTALPLLNGNPTTLDINYFNKMAEASLDVSIAFPLNNKNVFLHGFAGASLSTYLQTKTVYSTNFNQALNVWKNNLPLTQKVKMPSKIKFGMLLDVNSKWIFALEYYKLAPQTTAQILSEIKDNGFGIRVAYFYNKQKNKHY